MATTAVNIQVASVPSNRSNNNVWAVYVTGDEQNTTFCRNAFTAMKFCYILKERTGHYIAQESINILSKEIARIKALRQTAEEKAKAEAIQEKVEEFCEEHSVDNVLAKAEEEKKARARSKAKAAEPKAEKPKAQRKPRTKKAKEVAE